MDASEKEPTKLYTRAELAHIVSNFYATPSDYLIRTYLKIFRIDDGPLFEKFERRFNNIIFNNYEEICKLLTVQIFAAKGLSIVHAELANVTYLSCIFPVYQSPCPVFIQYFNPARGLQHRVVGYTASASSLSAILVQAGLIDRVVGHCGDYCYRDPSGRKNPSAHVSNVRVLSGRRVMDLPYSDKFTSMLFDLLLDYLPDDPSKALIRLGDTVMGISGSSQCSKLLITKYKEWLSSGQHILAGTYVDYVIKNYETINSYLLPCKYLPSSIGTLFNNVLQRFLLVFMTELYYEIDKIQLTDNNAIVYYFYLKRIRDTFQSFEAITYIPPVAYGYFNKEINHLIENKQLDHDKDIETIKTLSKEIMSIVDYTHSRATKFIEAILEQFSYLESHSWILLNDLPLKNLDIHKSYHDLHPGPCNGCQGLYQEITIVNSVLTKLPLVEIESVVLKWVHILKNCQVPRITKVLEYLLSLPASCNVTGGPQSGCEFGCSEVAVRTNMYHIQSEDVVEKVEEFFEDYWETVEEIVQKNQVRLLLE